ncbi:uncharacterized protein [Nicotiana sylvestris]|uniref:uncharacterized protein n=1 Tax=Nicotiana sylvestris TaxID=4096 RepID=UPI00388C886E
MDTQYSIISNGVICNTRETSKSLEIYSFAKFIGKHCFLLPSAMILYALNEMLRKEIHIYNEGQHVAYRLRYELLTNAFTYRVRSKCFKVSFVSHVKLGTGNIVPIIKALGKWNFAGNTQHLGVIVGIEVREAAVIFRGVQNFELSETIRKRVESIPQVILLLQSTDERCTNSSSLDKERKYKLLELLGVQAHKLGFKGFEIHIGLDKANAIRNRASGYKVVPSTGKAVAGVVISSFLTITLEDEGGLMGKWILDFCPIHVRDQIVYSCSSVGISKDGSCNGLEYYVSLERDIMVATTVNLIIEEQPTDVYTGISLSVHHVIKEDSSEDRTTDSNAFLDKLLTNHVEKTLVKQTMATSVYGVTSVGLCEQFKQKGEEKGPINDDKLLFTVSCYAAKFFHGAFYSFVQVDSQSTVVNTSCVLNSFAESPFLYNAEHTFMLIVIPAEGLYSSYSIQKVLGVIITHVGLWISDRELVQADRCAMT